MHSSKMASVPDLFAKCCSNSSGQSTMPITSPCIPRRDSRLHTCIQIYMCTHPPGLITSLRLSRSGACPLWFGNVTSHTHLPLNPKPKSHNNGIEFLIQTHSAYYLHHLRLVPKLLGRDDEMEILHCKNRQVYKDTYLQYM